MEITIVARFDEMNDSVSYFIGRYEETNTF